MNNYSTDTDLKARYGGILESPYVSKIHRHCLDGFKVKGLREILKPFTFKNILDVGCGLGEYSWIKKGRYFGLDNSFPRVLFAQRQYRDCHFVCGDAQKLPFREKSFEAVLLANTAHHLSDRELIQTLNQMKRIAQKYIILDDCVRFVGQNGLSRFFYRLDRGTKFRRIDDFISLFKQLNDSKLVLKNTHRTFPGLYLHVVFILELI